MLPRLNKKPDTKSSELSASSYVQCPEEAAPEAEGSLAAAGGEGSEVLTAWGF